VSSLGDRAEGALWPAAARWGRHPSLAIHKVVGKNFRMMKFYRYSNVDSVANWQRFQKTNNILKTQACNSKPFLVWF